MRFIKFAMIVIVGILLMPFVVQTSQAKGTFQRVIISSEALAQDIVVSDSDTLHFLSIGRLESFNCRDDAFTLTCGEVDPPPDIAAGYLLQRQFRVDTDNFQTFDEVIYYPSTTADQRGYVHYLGLVNGSSEYDNRWFYITREAEIAFQRLLQYPNLQNYILVAQENSHFPHILAFYDAETLDYVGSVHMPVDPASLISGVGVDASGRRLVVSLTGHSPEVFEADLAEHTACSLGSRQWIGTSFDQQAQLYLSEDRIEVRNSTSHELMVEIIIPNQQLRFFPSSDGLSLYAIDDSADVATFWQLDLQEFELTKLADIEIANTNLQLIDNADFASVYITNGSEFWVWSSYGEDGQSLDDIQLSEASAHRPIGMHHNSIYFFNPQGRYWSDAPSTLASGILVMAPLLDAPSVIWHEDIDFGQAISQNNALYGLSNTERSEEATLYRMDIETGEILAQTTLVNGSHFIEAVQLDAKVTSPDWALGLCPTPYLNLTD